MRTWHRARLLATAAVAFAAVPLQAYAQDAVRQDAGRDDEGIADIVVTATKMGESNLQSTPIAVSAITAEELASRGVRDVQDLKNYVPSLQVSDLSGYTQLYVRGIGSNIVFIGSDPSTTIHLDGVYLARPLSYLTDFLDVDRVEVLRGPQGTLYGRNSVGGTINVISRRPSDTFEAEFRGEYGTYDRYAAKAYASGPIGGGITASLAVDVSGHGAYRENVSTGGGAEDLKSRGVKGQVRVPLGTGQLTLRADYSRQSGAMAAYPKLIGPIGVPLDDSILDDPGKVAMDGVNHTVLENYGVSADLRFDIADGIELRSLTAWRAFHGSILADADSSSLPLFRNLIAPIRQRQLSQELSLVGKGDRFDWVVGAYYFNERNREPLTLTIYPFGVTHVQRPLLRAESFAVFGQGEFRLSDRLSVVAGLRYTTERKRYALDDRFTASTSSDPAIAETAPPLSGVPGIPDPFAIDTSRRDNALTPKFGINFRPNDNVLLYVSATRGFKSGGYDYGANNALDAAAGYGPEKLWSYEAGLKSDWLDRRLRVNLTGFYYDYTDLQVQSYVQVGASFGARTQNAATARVKGVEVEIVARPISSLQLYASVAYLDARYRDYKTAYVPAFGTFDASGNRLNNAPQWSATIGGSYRLDLGTNGSIELGGDVHTQSRIYFTAANAGVGGIANYPEQQGAYAVVNGRLMWTSSDGKFGIGVIGSNLTNRNYYVGTANYTPAISARQGRPREVIGQLSVKF